MAASRSEPEDTVKTKEARSTSCLICWSGISLMFNDIRPRPPGMRRVSKRSFSLNASARLILGTMSIPFLIDDSRPCEDDRLWALTSWSV